MMLLTQGINPFFLICTSLGQRDATRDCDTKSYNKESDILPDNTLNKVDILVTLRRKQ